MHGRRRRPTGLHAADAQRHPEDRAPRRRREEHRVDRRRRDACGRCRRRPPARPTRIAGVPRLGASLPRFFLLDAAQIVEQVSIERAELARRLRMRDADVTIFGGSGWAPADRRAARAARPARSRAARRTRRGRATAASCGMRRHEQRRARSHGHDRAGIARRRPAGNSGSARRAAGSATRVGVSAARATGASGAGSRARSSHAQAPFRAAATDSDVVSVRNGARSAGRRRVGRRLGQRPSPIATATREAAAPTPRRGAG